MMTAELRSIFIRMVLAVVVTLPAAAAHAEGRPIDPSKVAPEYREAAIKRQAEKKKISDCQKEAIAKKLLPRFRVEFLVACVDR